VRRSGDVVGFTAGEDEAQGTALGIGEDSHLGSQSTSGTPQWCDPPNR
jgi:hypothetical protein